jgi:putative membrane protein
MSGVTELFTQRPYVVAFFVAFALLSWSERGARRTLLWLLTGTSLGWLSELCSVRTGFPFGHYVYHQENFPSELWIGPVPLFASLSFAFMSYFAFSAACRLLAPEGAAGRRDDPSSRATVVTTLLAAIIAAWMDTVIDPLSLLGEYWFLGDLYHYNPPGPHFGVPFVNYAGWVLTVGAIVAVSHFLDGWQARRGVPLQRGPALPFRALSGLSCCIGVFVFMLSINVHLLIGDAIPPTVPLVPILVSGLVSFTLFVAFVSVMLRRVAGRTRIVASTAIARVS